MGIQGNESAPPSSAATAEMTNLYRSVGVPESKIDELKAPAERMNWFMKIFLNLQQVALENSKLQPLQDYTELIDRWYIFQMDWVTRADVRVREWLGLGRKQNENLARFIYEVENMEYLAPGELEPRLPTEQELAVIAQKHNLSPEALKLYDKIREDFLDVFVHFERVSVYDAQRTIQDPVRQAQEILKIQQEFAEARKRPYFPHARFGEYAVIARNRDTKLAEYLEHFESRRAAKANIRAIAKKYPNADTIIREVPKNARTFQGLPSVVLQQIRKKLDPTLSDEQKAWLDDYINELALTTGLRKKLARRRQIPGFSLDAMRAFANYFFTNSKYFARIEYGEQLESAIRDFHALQTLSLIHI